jgi:hypothetical protein
MCAFLAAWLTGASLTGWYHIYAYIHKYGMVNIWRVITLPCFMPCTLSLACSLVDRLVARAEAAEGRLQEAEVRHEKLLKRYEVVAAERMGLQKVRGLARSVGVSSFCPPVKATAKVSQLAGLRH